MGRIVVGAAFLAGVTWGISVQSGCMVCECPVQADPPALRSYTVVDAWEPTAIGGTFEVVEQIEGADGRVLVLTYDSPTDGELTVVYGWP